MSAPLWSIPWHYLGGTVCLLSDSRAGESARLLLFDSLVKDGDLKKRLDPNQSGKSGDPPLFESVRAAAPTSTKTRYDWTEPWPENLDLLLRTAMPAAAPLSVGPKAVTFSWPFPNDGNGDKSVAKRYASLGGHIPPVTGTESANGSVLEIGRLMHVADKIVAGPMSPLKESLIKPGADPKGIIERSGELSPAERWLPESFRVQVHAWLPTTRTRLVGFSTHLELHLGWLWHGDGRKGRQPILFDKWPCGSFNPP